jgi:hypothetical protein
MKSELREGAHGRREGVFRGEQDLRRPEEDEQRLPTVPGTLAELEKALLSSIERLSRREGVDGATLLRRPQKRMNELRSRG